MNSMVQDFKGDIFNSMFRLFGKTYLKITGAYTIYLIIIYALISLLFNTFVDSDIFAFGRSQTPGDLMQFAEKIKELMFTPEFLGIILISFFLLLLLQSWNYYFAYNLSNKQILNGNSNFVVCFKESFHVNVFKILGVTLLIGLIIMVGAFFAGIASTISRLLTFMLVIALFIFAFRLILIIPAMIIGNKTLGDSFAYSFTHITWFRALKLFGYTAIAFILVAVASLVISTIGIFLAKFPVAGYVFQFATQVFLGGFFLTLIVSATIALYYRYADEISEIDIEE
jgi:hypothetical protein